MTSLDRQEALEALALLEARSKPTKAPPEARREAIALQMQAMTEYAMQQAEKSNPGFRARFERMHAEFCVLMGAEP